MNQVKQFAVFIPVLAIWVVLQAIFVMADCRDTPGTAAANFTKAYYGLNPALGDMLCQDLAGDEEADPVADYFNRVQKEARATGHDLGYMRSKLLHLHTVTAFDDDTRAVVQVSGERKRNINPVFTLVAKWFFLGKTYPVEHTYEVVREDGQWKICGQPFALSGV